MYGNSASTGTVEDTKLFVGGLGWETSEKQIKEYFDTFGEVESISVKTNPNTGRSRGFAFVTYTSKDSVDKVVNQADHYIEGRKIDPKRAMARTGKLFVGGLKAEISDDDVKNHFSQFGSIIDVEVPFDKQKNQRRGFCFITFEQEHVANELLKNPTQVVNGHHLDLRKAQPKVDYPPSYAPRGGGYGSGGYGGGSYRGGRGGYYGGGGYPPYAGGYGGYGGGGYDSYGYGDGYSNYGAGGYDYSNGYGGYGHNYSDGGSSKRGYARHQPY